MNPPFYNMKVSHLQQATTHMHTHIDIQLPCSIAKYVSSIRVSVRNIHIHIHIHIHMDPMFQLNMEPMLLELPSSIPTLLFSTQNFMMVLGCTKDNIQTQMALLETLEYDDLWKCIKQLQLNVSQIPLLTPTRTMSQIQQVALEPSPLPRNFRGECYMHNRKLS